MGKLRNFTQQNKSKTIKMGMFDFGASAINIGLQAYHNRKQNEWNVTQSNIKYARDIEQRDYMNQYNSPYSQMERFKEAGLNPNMIYGKGTPGQQSAAPSYSKAAGQFSTPGISVGDPLMELNKYQSFRKGQADTDLTREVINGQQLDNALKHSTMTTKIAQQVHQLAYLISKTTNEHQKKLLMIEMTELKNQQNKIEKIKYENYEKGIENSPWYIRMSSKYLPTLKKVGNDLYQGWGGVIPEYLNPIPKFR